MGVRFMGESVWNRRVARLPERGTLLYCTDLQGNLRDYEAMKAVYFAEKAAGNEPILAFCGDLVHGPSDDLLEPNGWPEHLGTPYRDESAKLVLDFEQLSRTERVFSLLGNHEHSHIGGPVVSKFHVDEASVLEQALGRDRARIRDFFREFPLLAVSPSGVVLTHAAPRNTERRLEDFERIVYDDPDGDLQATTSFDRSTLIALLWARAASPAHARALLAATSLGNGPNTFVAYGHDVVADGYDVVGKEQICLSTSFGLYDEHKVYLKLDLSRRYESAAALRPGYEIIRLYPEAP